MENLYMGIAHVIGLSVQLYTLLIIARVVMSWVGPDVRKPIVRFVYGATDPVLDRVRSILPSFSGLDFSPVLVLFALHYGGLELANFFARQAEAIGAG